MNKIFSPITTTIKSFLMRVATLTIATLFFLLAVLFLPQRFILATFLLLFLTILLNLLSRSETFTFRQTISTADSDYELAKRRWKKELKGTAKVKASAPEQQEKSRRNKGILPSTFSSQTSADIMKLVKRSGPKELEYQRAKTRLSNEINDRILEKRIRTEFLKIKDAPPDQYEAGLREIRKLLNLRKERLIC